MRRILLALVTLWILPGLAGAVELKNVRPCYGPLGATRTDLKAVIPGDLIFISFDIEGLAVDPKTSKVSYSITLEMFDSQDKSLLKKETPSAEAFPQLGGNRMPGDLHVILDPKQAPGKYTIRLTVVDKNSKDSKSFSYPFMIVPAGFGLVGVTAPGIGYPGQQYIVQFAATNMKLDEAKKPKVDISMKILEGDKSVATPVYIYLPKDIPDTLDIAKENFVTLSYPIYLNRPGRFTVEITAIDANAKRTVTLRYPLTVLDVSGLTGGGGN